ncbi:response regulator transcription factor [Acetivibrio saccincola]|jgi:DNA-binding NarL/FixJ family response regulator|uniref:Stage 0 sporulation protein A homolog n=1 Tax=Acetivibrio saccincola TaxID=1677857 RepID=A0A2K9EGE2_9FIRM|nr:response regulator transcription factor [Acetivibrio saccincola]AUG56973.1 Response regulator protein VraR [Acetivibrio saccincola]NLW27056.1 response regulator transcription factor [Acetivibrio saccincola]PQQ66994.1 DNA-binding response regulator [Acetivibrio saccincola]HQD29899.1 response regulator transcription factor [Acetivibrio saccincola]
MIRVIIADDQKLLSESLKTIIENDPDISVIDCVENGQQAFERCKEQDVDLVLMDIRMPECDGITGTKLIKENCPHIKVLILTTFEDDKSIYDALKSGADGYILKDITPEELIQAVKNTVKGFGIFSKNPYSSLVNNINAETKEEVTVVKDFEFKERDVEIMKMVAKGMTNKDIAQRVCLSVGRVKNIISEILSKLDLADRNQLASYVHKNFPST